MRTLGVFLYWLGIVLMWIAGIVIGVSMLWGWYKFGFGWVQDTFSPFNLYNFIATVIALSPGIGFTMAGEYLIRKADLKEQRMQ